jgi:sigma-B regulation protein RsbU (phosphoserine phosphatase)
MSEKDTLCETQLSPILHSLVDRLTSPVMILDGAGKIIYTNQYLKEIFGDVIGQGRVYLFHDTVLSDERTTELPDGSAEVILADVAYLAKWSSVLSEQGERFQMIILDDISADASMRERLKSSVKKIRQDSDIAKHIQASILPANGEYDNAVRICSLYFPADDLGGDVFGIVKVSPHETLFYIADVSGHGIQASLLTVYLREKIRATGRRAAEGLDVLAQEVLRDFVSLDIDASIYATVLFCCYNKERGSLSIANAGHNCMPLILRAGGRTEEVPVRGMPISKISSFVGEQYTEEVVGIRVGDRVVLYTDGLIEEYSRAEKGVFGADGMRKIAEENHQLEGRAFAKKLVEESEKYVLVSAKDDRAILVVDIIG